MIHLNKPHEELLWDNQVRVVIGLEADDSRPLGLPGTPESRLQVLESLHVLTATAETLADLVPADGSHVRAEGLAEEHSLVRLLYCP